jgi:hypothetical protein
MKTPAELREHVRQLRCAFGLAPHTRTRAVVVAGDLGTMVPILPATVPPSERVVAERPEWVDTSWMVTHE